MQEYILSFKNDQHDRKYEYLFKYNVKDIIDKYDFIYKRDGIIINIKLLKGLATISKVAKPFNTKYIDQLIKLYRKPYDSKINNGIFFKLPKYFNTFPLVNIIKIKRLHKYTKELFLYRPLDRHPMSIFYKKENIAFVFNDDLLRKPLNLYKNIIFTSDKLIRKSFDIYDDILLTSDKLNRKPFSIYNNIRTNRINNDLLSKIHNPNRDLIKKYKKNYYFKIYDNYFYKHSKDLPGYQTEFYDHEFIYRKSYNIRVSEYYIALSNIYAINQVENFLGLDLIYTGKTNIFNTYLAKQTITNRNINLYEYDALRDTDNYYLNLFENRNANKTGTNTLNLYKDFNLSSDNHNYISNIYENFSLFPYNDGKINIIPDLLLKDNNDKLQIEDKIYDLEDNNTGLNINNYRLLNKDSNTGLNINDNNLLYKITNNIFNDGSFSSLREWNNTLFVYDDNKTYKLNHKLTSINSIDFGSKLSHYLRTQSLNSLKKDQKNVDTYNNINVYRTLNQIYTNYSLLGHIYPRHTRLSENINVIRNLNIPLKIYRQDLVLKTLANIYIINSNKDLLYKKSYDIYKNVENIFINKTYGNIYTETNINNFVYKVSKDIFMQSNVTDFANKSKYSIYRQNYYEFALKTHQYIYKQALDNTFTYKIPYNIYLTNVKDTQLIKEGLSTKYIQDNIIWIGNKIIPIMLNSDNKHLILSISKINGELYTEKIIDITNKARQIDGDLNQTSVIKDKLELNINLHLVCDKFAHNITLTKMLDEFVIKSQIFTAYYNHEDFVNKYLYANAANNFERIDRSGLYITPTELYGFTTIQTILKEAIADNNIDWFDKSLSLYVDSDELLSKIGDIHLFNHVFLGQIKDLCVFTSADNLYRLQKITETHINNVYAFKNIKEINTFKTEFASDEKNLNLYKHVFLYTENVLKVYNYDQLSNERILNVYENISGSFDITLNVYENIHATHDLILNTFKSEWLKHIRLNVYLQSKELQLFREKNIDLNDFRGEVSTQLNRESDLAVYNQGLSLETQNIIHIIQNEHFLAKEDNMLSVLPEHYLIDKDIILNKLPELEDIRRIIKEGNLMTDNLDFAWILEDDDPFNDPFKLDELLLPENDTRYEDFEDIVFNRETGKPRNTVKVIDSRHFIAKYPIHYPIKDRYDNNAYENIAKKYLVVKTDIMKEVFLAYYKIWQAHVFEFARMTMPQSAKKMLDYLYTWILITLPGERIPEALRVFRLIRWYLECGIIESSEYEIEYEASDLTSGKLNTTDIDIPCSLNTNFDEDHPIDPSMYIDTQLHIIRNNEHMLRDEAKFTMYINNDINTTITFYLNTESPVDIILNGNIIDHINIPTHGKMLYNIPYTEDVNIFTIRKLAIDNNDPRFFIGNINIAGIGNSGELNISFNPTLQGNKLLNNVSQKTNAYFNLIYNNKDYLEQVVKNNLHLDDVYDKLKTYWNLHHQDKEKGKRWMIKET